MADEAKFMPDYQYLTEGELLQVASEKDQLTDLALLELDAELNRRKLTSSDINSHLEEYRSAEEEDQLRRAAPQLIGHQGFGKKFLGKANRQRDPDGRFETYDSTLWFVIMLFPFFPLGTYTVRQEFRRWLGVEWPTSPVAIERHPRNWEQILMTWVRAMLVLWTIILLLSHPQWILFIEKRFR